MLGCFTGELAALEGYVGQGKEDMVLGLLNNKKVLKAMEKGAGCVAAAYATCSQLAFAEPY